MSELDHWKERLSKGAVSRREFIERAAALGASSLAISQMLASADAIAAETPKKGHCQTKFYTACLRAGTR